MFGTETLDALDQRILNAFQIDPRVSWGKLAEVLGENDRTVARRAQRLLSGGVSRITAIPDDQRYGSRVPIHICAQTPMGELDRVAEELAQRGDVRTVLATTGDEGRLWFELVVPERALIHSILADELPARFPLRGMRSHVVLRMFSATSQWYARHLTDEEIAALRRGSPAYQDDTQPSPATGTGRDRMDELDVRIAKLLQRNGRATISGIAEELKTSVPTASRRLEAMLARRHVQLRAEIASTHLGLSVEAQLHLTVNPGAVEETGRYLATLPEVRYCVAVTDSRALLLDIAVATEEDVYRFISHVSGELPGIVGFEVSLITRTYKRGGLRRDGSLIQEYA
ncbi:Lrp/AsnC family transcriptional regulator [Streptomyces flavidovirens]|uniref:Lrp/AsnC family transcriptional regulator n=1 Tax=Streptomyces flavidovirens TaxID=67298 RepID=UPI000422B8C5|nr:Lrp/AsnC family transcriptional regulator [Streptomyces flavidovirens]